MRTDQLALSRYATDRDAERRSEPGLLERLAADPETRLLLVDARGRVALSGPAIHPDLPDDGLTPPSRSGGPGTTAGEGPGTRNGWGLPDLRASCLEACAPTRCPDLTVLYAGRELADDGAPTGPTWIAVVVPPALEVPNATEPPITGSDAEGTAVDHPDLRRLLGRYPLSALRAMGAQMTARDAGLATTATALAAWHARSFYCPVCGGRTEIIEAGWARRCTDCATVHFPRTDPAVIMAVTDESDRLLLVRGATWVPRRYSVVAGFVEAGEAVEAAVAREVWEETGMRVAEVEYVASQPWPFPRSLMLGCRARLVPGQDPPRPDGREVVEARLVSRDELTAGARDGSILLPGPTSIARLLIEDWYGGPIAG